MRTIIIIQEETNYFGDTVLNYKNQTYPVFQYNCRAGRELLKLLEAKRHDEIVLISNEVVFISEVKVILTPAIPYLKECIKTNDIVNTLNIPRTESAGAEIAGRYGY
jgi:hypothetical protein